MLLSAAGVDIRPATRADNPALADLARACPVRAAVTLCVHRDPDYFALSRLQGDPWRVFVAEARAAGVVGCVAVAERRIWLNGSPARLLYIGDLKVDVAFRGRGVGDRLLGTVRDWCATRGADVPVLITTLVGNAAIERRVPGIRGLPSLTPIGVVRVHTVFAGAGRQSREPLEYRVRSATPSDQTAMADLWARVAPARNGAPVLDSDGLGAWIAAVPGLSLSDYLLAFAGDRLVGFVGLWDPRAVKETLVLAYGRVAAIARAAYNTLACARGAAALPPAGASLHALQALHPCVPPGEPTALRALVAAARRRCVREGLPALVLGLDRDDPLAAALRAVPRVGADVRCFLTSPGGRYGGPMPDGRPIYLETALV